MRLATTKLAFGMPFRRLFVILFLGLLPVLALGGVLQYDHAPNQLLIRFTNDSYHRIVKSDFDRIAVPTGISALDELFTKYDVGTVSPLLPHTRDNLADPTFLSSGLNRSYKFIVADRFSIRTTEEITALADELLRTGLFEHAEPNFACYAMLTPNDWSLAGRNMWGLDSMHCRPAWDRQTGSQDILAVTIDTGVDYLHPDLAPNILLNPGEDINSDGTLTAADSNNIDDDNNGYVDDFIGWDFVSHAITEVGGATAAVGEDYAPPDNNPSDVHGHGTHVCGTLAARTNNNVGVPAASYNIRTQCLRAGFAILQGTNLGGVGFNDNFIEAVGYAIRRGARVVSISFGGTQQNTAYSDVINLARANNVLVFAAAGNSNSSTMRYPGAYTGSIGVAATDRGNVKAAFSNFGNWVDISAPGVDIWSTMVVNTYNPDPYVAWEGTSMATPNAASVAALILSRNPNLSDDALWNVLSTTAGNIDAVNPTFIGQLGAGIVDANAALNAVAPPVVSLISPNGGETLWHTQYYNIRWRAADSVTAVTIQMNRSYGDPNSTWEDLYVGTPNDSAQLWQIAGAVTDSARIRIFRTSNPAQGDTSDFEFSIHSPWLTLTAPAEPVEWPQGIPQTITWNSGGMPVVDVQLNRNFPSQVWEPLATSVTNRGFISWNVTGPATSNARVRVLLTDYEVYGDTLDSNITILTPGLTIAGPNGGEIWNAGLTKQITWATFGVSRVHIDLNRDYPNGAWERTHTNILSNRQTNWVVSGPPSTNCRFRIVNASDSTMTDISNASFTILNPDVDLLSPNGSETITRLTVWPVTWTFLGCATVKVELNRNYPSGTWEQLIASTPGAPGVWNWNVNGAISQSARLRIVDTSNSAWGDTSESSFSIINPNVTVRFPNASDSTYIGLAKNITWQSLGITGNVNIELNRNYPNGTWEMLFANVADNGSRSWTPNGAESETARIRVSSITDPNAVGLSNGEFHLWRPFVTVLTPNGGETLEPGSIVNLRWNTNLVGTVNIHIDRNYPSGQWQQIFSQIPNDGLQPWPVSAPTAARARIRVTHVQYPAVVDLSDTNFVIGIVSVRDGGTGIPTEFAVLSPQPNPFNPETSIRFDLPAYRSVSITVHSVTGRQIRTLANRGFAAGAYDLKWDGRDDAGNSLSSGVYFVRINAGGTWQQSQKLLLVR